jgi:hypothetical protein
MRPLMDFACLGTIACSLALIPAAQAGKVISARIDELVEASERIVLAKVESIQDGPNQKVHRARATVKEVWKGPKVETVEYRIGPRRYLVSSGAMLGETVLLFLAKEDGDWRIAWSGYGRMTLETQDSKEYLSYWGVIFPDGTPSTALSGDKKGRSDKGVELKLVKELIVGKIGRSTGAVRCLPQSTVGPLRP